MAPVGMDGGSRRAIRRAHLITFQAIAFYHLFQRYGLRLPRSDVDQPLLGKVQVLKIVQVLLDGFPFSCPPSACRRPSGDGLAQAFQ